MLTSKESRTNTPLWIAAVGSLVLMLSVGVVMAEPLPNVKVCHKGNSIVVNANSLPAHLPHGDTLGTCDNVCACQPSIEPVTCANGNTYINECVATCDGATGCTPDCSICSTTVNPVLCTTGNVYDNLCLGRCAGEECYYVTNAVICDPAAGCQGGPLFAPVICPNGASYVNAALADCCLHGETDGCRDGACLFTCPSTANPVTCANGTTYVNACYATCDGATGCAP